MSTAHRILDAATDVFVESGYHGATVREICRRANANVAAVNYHFTSKLGLYQAVIVHLMEQTLRRLPLEEGQDPSAPPDVRLKRFIAGFLQRILHGDGQEDFVRKGRLISREVSNPRIDLSVVVDIFVTPHSQILRPLIAELLGDAATPERVRDCSLSVVGQCFYYMHARPMLEAQDPSTVQESENIERLAHHVTVFSLGGIRAVAAASGSITK